MRNLYWSINYGLHDTKFALLEFANTRLCRNMYDLYIAERSKHKQFMHRQQLPDLHCIAYDRLHCLLYI